MKWKKSLTTDDETKEDTDDEIPDGHHNHDARDGEIFRSANAVRTAVVEK